MIEKATIERIREATDLVALVGETVELRRAGKEFRGLCPFHDDHEPSLGVNPEKRRWFCHPCHRNGDAFSWLMARDGIDFREAVREFGRRAGIQVPDEAHRPSVEARAGVTVAQWARAKKLDLELIKALNITDTVWSGAPAIEFPFYVTGRDANPTAVHIRRTLEKHSTIPRFAWRPGGRTVPYGLWLLSTSDVRTHGRVVLVEGETDFITLLQYNIPALGIPGNAWQESWSPYLKGIPRIIVSIEPDDGGHRLITSLRRSSLWDRCELVPFGDSAHVEEVIA